MALIKKTTDPFALVNSRHGAPMGRHGFGTPTANNRAVRSRWVDGDYDRGGAYWGHTKRGEYIYALVDKSEPPEFIAYTRASSAVEARANIFAADNGTD